MKSSPSQVSASLTPAAAGAAAAPAGAPCKEEAAAAAAAGPLCSGSPLRATAWTARREALPAAWGTCRERPTAAALGRPECRASPAPRGRLIMAALVWSTGALARPYWAGFEKAGSHAW